jgi:hypothetical protein
LVKGKQTASLDGERSFIERYIRPGEFETLFGGEMLLTDPNGSSEFIGVWGRKAISDFKRTLRERGSEFAVLPVDASGRVVKRYSQHRIRPSTVPNAVKNPNC